MRMLCTFGILSLFVSANAFAGGVFYGDSGISGPPYDRITAASEELAAAHPDFADVFVYGKSVRGHPLHGLRLADKALQAQDMAGPAVLITGVIHGNEYLGIEDRLPAHFLNNRDDVPELSRFLAAGGGVYAEIDAMFLLEGARCRDYFAPVSV